MNGQNVWMAINTAMLSVILTLAAVIYRDLMRRVTRVERQVMSVIGVLLSLVNNTSVHVPEHIIAQLQDALKSE